MTSAKHAAAAKKSSFFIQENNSFLFQPFVQIPECRLLAIHQDAYLVDFGGYIAHQKESQEKKPSLFAGLGVLFSTLAFWIILFYFAAPSLPGWAIKNWSPTLFSESLGIPMSEAGPISTITIAVSSFIGVIMGGILSDRWVQRNIRGRVYTGAIGLGLTVPALLLLGFGHSLPAVVGAGLLFGIGYGIFDANNMPILCQFV